MNTTPRGGRKGCYGPIGTPRRAPRALLAALFVPASLALPAAAPRAASATSQAPAPAASQRPGPDVLYAPPADVPLLQAREGAPWRAEPLLVSGAHAVVEGEYLYQGWLYDDNGAAGVVDPGDQHRTQFLFAGLRGTLTYPTDPVYADNAADIVELRVTVDEAQTRIRLTLNTLIDPERTAATFAIGESAASLPWPHGAGVSSPAELFLTVHGSTAELTATTGTAVQPAPTAAVDVVRNQIEIAIPRQAWDPGRDTVSLRAGAGLWDVEGGGYLAPAPAASATAPGGVAASRAALFDMAFRTDEAVPDWETIGRTTTIGDSAAVIQTVENCFWRDCAQADALARGDVSAFDAEIDFGALSDGETDTSGVPTTGPMNRILPSAFAPGRGEGIDFDAACGRHPTQCDGVFHGALQPYTIFVPEGPAPAGGWPLVVLLHPSTGNYNIALGNRYQRQMGALDGGAIVITPMAREAQGDYTDLTEADVFEVWADVARRYPLNAARTVLTGYSMGAGGTFKLAERWPDLFARGFAAAAIPRTGGAEGQHLDALHHVPTMVWIGAADGTTVDQQNAILAELDAQDLPHAFWQFPTSDHLTLATNDEWRPAVDFLSGAMIDPNPPRIRYVVDPRNDHADTGVVADHAFWLSAIRTAAGQPGVLDVRSEGLGIAEQPVDAPTTTQGTVDGGYHGPMAYQATTVAPPERAAAPAADVLHMTLRGVTRVTVDLDRAGLTCGGQAQVDTDVAVTLELPACGGIVDVPVGTSTVDLAQAGPDTGETAFTDFSCPARSWVAGTSVLCGGVLTHRDYVYDDYGADLGGQGSSTGSMTVPAGDIRYPAGAQPNTADLVDLSLRVVGDRLEILAELNALFEPDSTLVAVALDTDDDAATGGGEWPGFGVTSAGWDELHVVDAADPLANTIGGSVVLPPGETWRVQAVVAQADGPAAGVATDHAVMNVAFRGPDERSSFVLNGTSPPDASAMFDEVQAAALAAGDISAFGQVVDVADLRPGGRAAELDTVGPGLHERVYTSDVTLPPGEGMSYTGIRGRGTGGPTGLFGQIFDYFGRYQPYGLYLPDAPGPHQLGLIHHGSGQSHAGLVNLPGFQTRLAEEPNRILASPLARGPDGYGSDISERDLLDVRADVLAHYDIDEASVHVGGYSQGGYLAFRQSMLHPDEYASFISWVGFSGDATSPVPTNGATAGAVGRIIDLVRNVRHVPGAMVYGGADELTSSPNAEAIGTEFRRQDFPYIFYMHPAAEHFTFALLDDWAKETAYGADRTRVVDPLRVTFRTAEVLGEVDAGVRHDRAYWVSQIRGVDTTDDPLTADQAYIDVDLLSEGCGGEIPTVALTPGAGPDPVPWISDSNVETGTRVIPAAARLSGSLANVRSLVVDLEATCLTGAFEYAITADRPGVLRFTDGRRLELAEGDNTGTLAVAGAAPVTTRVAGPDRIATAIAVSQRSSDSAGVAVIARADDYADALGAGPLAAQLDAPVLLTEGDVLDDRVVVELERLGVEEVVVVGGRAAVAPQVEAALASRGLAVRRLGGETRFDTAGRVATAVVEAGGDGSSVYLVEGRNDDPNRGWPDAVAAGALAARQGRPILLTTRDDLPSATRQALAELGTVEVTAVGGTAAVSQRTLAMAADPDGDGQGQVALNRIHGSNRYETSAKVADRTLVDLAATEQVWLVTGRNWPDALTAAPAAARSGGVLLLVDGETDGGGDVPSRWRLANAPAEETVLVGGRTVLRGREAAATAR